MSWRLVLAISILLFPLTVRPFTVHAESPAHENGPLGVLAKVDVETAEAGYKGPASGLHPYLRKLYSDLLKDPAVSGLTFGQYWDHIETGPPTDTHGYDWSFLDDAFDSAKAASKPVQLMITPGVNSPSWVLDELPSCDGLFTSGATVAEDCGKVTFPVFPEQDRADSMTMPLPWEQAYQDAWRDFLKSLREHFKDNPLFVSIALAGPVGESPEMIYPTNANTNGAGETSSGLEANEVWSQVIQHDFPNNQSYKNSDQAFIDAWDATIDTYEKVFSGVTLVVNSDAGDAWPQYGSQVSVHPDNVLYDKDCAESISGAKSDGMSCEAKTEVLSYFLKATGPNGKATQVGGMTSRDPSALGDIGLPGVKFLTMMHDPTPLPSFSGGAEFDFPVSRPNTQQQEGCPTYPTECPNLTAEQAAYNVLSVFFDKTSVGSDYGAAAGDQKIQFLQVPYVDVEYAEKPEHSCPTDGDLSLQDLLAKANSDLLSIAGRKSEPSAGACSAH